MRKYFEISKINLMNNLAYAGEFFLKAGFILIILFIFVNIWKAAYSGKEIIEGFTLSMIIWYMLMTEAIVTSGSTIIREVNADVQSGGIAYQLNKPYSYIGYYFSKSISYKLISFIITFTIGAGAVYFLIGKIPLSPSTIPLIIISVILALVLDFFMLLCIALLAFWFEDTTSLRWIYDKILFTIGGMLIPLEIFPDWLEKISANLPFSFAVYQPAKLFVNFEMDTFLKITGIQIGYILIFLIIAILIYRKGVGRVNINGG
jgi:ABC-2 type transport system permease protein